MIRMLNPNDSAAILSVFRSIKSLNSQLTGFASWSESKFLDELKMAHVMVCDDDRVKGFVLYRTIPDGYEITLLGTDPRFQKQGVMVKILTGIQNLLNKDHVIWLEVHEKNHAARCLYEKLGFKTTGRRPRYYSDGADCLNLEYKS